MTGRTDSQLQHKVMLMCGYYTTTLDYWLTKAKLLTGRTDSQLQHKVMLMCGYYTTTLDYW
ncbi:MAG: hypothetical protein PHY15_08675, partial [Eubacteriales bacterium]|nr:hypothetical protein [Eubacteriales bacterium]